jgi:hypothetical protein
VRSKRGALTRWVKDALRAYSASVAITIGALNTGLPAVDLSRRVVLERTLDSLAPNRFDPREVVARRIVITLPLDDPTRASDPDKPLFVPN